VEYVNNDFSKIFTIDFGLQIEWQPKLKLLDLYLYPADTISCESCSDVVVSKQSFKPHSNVTFTSVQFLGQ